MLKLPIGCFISPGSWFFISVHTDSQLVICTDGCDKSGLGHKVVHAPFLMMSPDLGGCFVFRVYLATACFGLTTVQRGSKDEESYWFHILFICFQS